MFVEYRHVFSISFWGGGSGRWYGLGGGRWGDRVTLTSHQLGHTKMSPRFKASSKTGEVGNQSPNSWIGFFGVGWEVGGTGVGGREQRLCLPV